MLEENSNKQLHVSQSEDRLLANIYKNKLIRCGVSKRDAERLATNKTIDELKKVCSELKQSIAYNPTCSNSESNETSKVAITSSSNGTCRVWSIRPTGKHRHLSCSRKRTKVDKALSDSQTISSDNDPLKHLGYLDDELKEARLEGLIESYLNHNRHGQEREQETH